MYRKAIIDLPGNRGGRSMAVAPTLSYEEDASQAEHVDDEDLQTGIQREGGKYIVRFSIAHVFYPMIYGRRKVQLNELERDTRTEISLPEKGSVSSVVCIKGPSQRAVLSAKERLLVIVASGRAKMDPTHFVCVPLNSVKMQASVSQLKADILRTCSESRGLDASIFVSPAALHLTCFVLKLVSEEEIAKAKQIMQTLAPDLKQMADAGGSCPARLVLKGLEIMNDDQSSVDVVYAQLTRGDITGLNRLKQIVELLLHEFLRAELISNEEVERQHLFGLTADGERFLNAKFHMTLLNTKQRQPREEKASNRELPPKQHPRESLDATALLRRYANVDLGQEPLTALHLSCMHRANSSSFYTSVCAVDLTSHPNSISSSLSESAGDPTFVHQHQQLATSSRPDAPGQAGTRACVH
jgi:hypothetical protein